MTIRRRETRRNPLFFAGGAAALGGILALQGQATEVVGNPLPVVDSLAAEKCALYESAARDAISLQGPEGLRVMFLTENQKFIDGGCVTRVKICPMTGEEWQLAETLLNMMINEGMASTFVPFGCP